MKFVYVILSIYIENFLFISTLLVSNGIFFNEILWWKFGFLEEFLIVYLFKRRIFMVVIFLIIFIMIFLRENVFRGFF